MKKRQIVTSLIVVAVLGTLIYLQVEHWRRFDWGKFRGATGEDHFHFLSRVAIAVALIYFTYVLRAVRWQVFLRPACRARFTNLLAPTFIGFSGMALLGRPGEFIRSFLIAKKEHLTVSSQIGVWAVERIFDLSAFAVLMILAVFLPNSSVQSNPYIGKFQEAAVGLSALIAGLAVLAFVIRKRGSDVAAALHRWVAPRFPTVARHIEQKVRAFGEGLNTIQDRQSLLQLIALSLAIWFTIALAYREVAHAYPPEAGHTQIVNGQRVNPPVVDVQTAILAGSPVLAGQSLDDATIADLRAALEPKGYTITVGPRGGVFLYKGNHRLKRIGDRPHLSDLDISHTILLMGFSMVGSMAQLPAVGGGSQLAVISALQVIYGIPPEVAVSCGILLWLVTFMAVIPVGLGLAHREHASLHRLSQEAEAEGEREEESAEAAEYAGGSNPS